MPDIMTGYKWELYNIAEDYSENNDLAASNPAKLAEMQKLFLNEAAKYNVFPLDNSGFVRLLTDAPERHHRADGVHLYRREPRHSRGQCAEHPRS